MTCERIREQIPECLAGQLAPAAREKLIEHLEACAACRAEMAALGEVWRGLETMQQPESGDAMRSRFLESLRAYQEGWQDAQLRRAQAAEPRKSFWAGWWPAQPAWQAAFSAALLLAGASVGRWALAPRTPAANPEIVQLQAQVENLRQMVALSLLDQSSASARLQGVTYSYQVARPDQQVEQALLHAVNHDPNVNVRLSAVDALAKFGGEASVRRGLMDSLPVQDSPLVQVALIDLLAQLKDPSALPALQTMAREVGADEDVRKRAAAAVVKLGGSR